jgi:hypothetical protein
MKYTKLMSMFSHIGTNAHIVIYFENGLIVESEKNIGVFETDNCVDTNEFEYHEYYACGVTVSKIIQSPKEILPKEIIVDNLIEISELNEPLKIGTKDGSVLWSREK